MPTIPLTVLRKMTAHFLFADEPQDKTTKIKATTLCM